MPKVSPYVSRLRLATEIVDARRHAGYGTERLQRETGIQRQRISHIENARRRVETEEIKAILHALDVRPDRFQLIMKLAEGSVTRGWWERYDDEMGIRQARIADLESGAVEIFQYQPFLIPGLLQTRDFASVRAEADHPDDPRRFSAARMLEARAQRQAILSGPDAVRYTVVLDEAVLRRRIAPPEVMHEQILHLISAALHEHAVTIRILPLAAGLENYMLARAAFARYVYADPHDPVVVTVDTDIEDTLVTEPATVSIYNDLCDRLRRAALTSVFHLGVSQ
ncbi:Scr1 family TA system antitoxin-like transcriptional regulator [Actinoplanes sp. DH11]|uniref:Scr1 family TA system antitoxin-like transcriptional regulator n=1 Tax=Actinoplanes sp. DH11 TaxID=2857011 RepID=UPI001E324C21|nr:Scr1 family TA system antitoxin-like transcriptional regulator [Actinoplanes sp. DH11]